MPICKLCFKQFAIIQASHVKKEHGFESLDEYKEATKDIEIPAELEEQDKIYREELRQKRIKSHSKGPETDQPADNTGGQPQSPSETNKGSLNGVLQCIFKAAREE